MQDTEFNQLVSEYLDGEITAERTDLLRSELLNSAERRREFQRQRRIAIAMRDWDAVRRPSWREILRDSFRSFSPFRLCRAGALALNAAILLFAATSFQTREQSNFVFSTDTPALFNATGNAITAGADTITAAPPPTHFVAADPRNSTSTPAGNAANDSSDDFDSDSPALLTEEYDFVRL